MSSRAIITSIAITNILTTLFVASANYYNKSPFLITVFLLLLLQGLFLLKLNKKEEEN